LFAAVVSSLFCAITLVTSSVRVESVGGLSISAVTARLVGDAEIYAIVELSALQFLVPVQSDARVLTNNSGNEMANCPWPGRFAPS